MSAYFFKHISTTHPLVPSLFHLCIGNPTQEKVHTVLQSYKTASHILVGCFSHNYLIAVMGIYLGEAALIIRHLGVLPDWQKKGVGRACIDYLVCKWPQKLISVETDKQAVNFYKKIGFNCQEIINNGNPRYHCKLDNLQHRG